MRRAVIIIPALNPDDKLIKYVQELIDNGFENIIVVDDGSRVEKKSIFMEIEKYKECTVLYHAINMGKGRALKNAFNYYLINFSGDYKGVITADSDGQHTVQDVLKLEKSMGENMESLTLGVRDFNRDNVPYKSKFGNKLTRSIIKLLYGGSISDTQTGLRAIPNSVLYKYLDLYGERFEYETTMLIESLHNNIPINEVQIETVYISNNKETHFRPIADSWAIYKLIFTIFFKYILSSISSAVVDFLIFSIFTFILRDVQIGLRIGIATVVARIISSLYNYCINKNIVFKGNGNNTFLKYYILCILQMCCSMGGVYVLCYYLHLDEIIAKVIVDGLLFLLSFQIQRTWIFDRSM